MYKEVILARFISRRNIEDYIKEEIDGKIPYKYEFQSNIIKTENVNIKCVIIPVGVDDQRKYVRGLRASICFGFDKSAEDYLTRGHAKHSGYLTNYILEKNGVKKNVQSK